MTRFFSSTIKYKMSGKSHKSNIIYDEYLLSVNIFFWRVSSPRKVFFVLGSPRYEVVIHLEKEQSPMIKKFVPRMSSS